MSKDYKELVNEALHNYFHEDTETEMEVKDWVCELQENADNNKSNGKAKVYDTIVGILSTRAEHGYDDTDIVGNIMCEVQEFENKNK